MKGFDIINKLGDGAYSIVYKVRRKADNKIYALKKVKLENLNEKEKNNSLNEVRILASIKSPFVISYKEAFISEEDSCLCLVMEYADKGDLYQKITSFKKRRQLFEESDVWKIFIQITRGLKSLHDLKILHRDFKSANIFLFGNGLVKIGDLNVSKVVNKGLGHTQTGTPYYASPEVWNNDSYDIKSDIWSLGVITYEILTLNPPFKAETFEELYKKVTAGKYSKINSKYSNDMNDLLKLLFKVNPKERPTCGEILKHPLIQKRIEYFKSQTEIDIDVNDDNELLRTIRISKNLIGLQEKLPKANYNSNKTEESKNKNNNNNAPKIINTFPNNILPSIDGSKTKRNLNTNTGNFNNNNNSLLQNKRIVINNVNRNNNLYTSPGNKHIRNLKMEKKNNSINLKKKNNLKVEKRLIETYKLYVSKDAKKYLSKRNILPKIIIGNNIKSNRNKK